MDNIFSIKNEDLERLSDKEAVEFFRDLLHAKARSLGIPINNINVSSDIYVADGGIDASVKDSPIESDLIKKGNTSYQLKTGKDFNPLVNSKIKKELIEKSKKGRPTTLKAGIKDCLENDGTYILVCFGREFNNLQKPQAELEITNIFKDYGYPKVKVEVWGQNQLQGFFDSFPSLALRLNGRNELKFQSHSSWAENDLMQTEFVYGERQIQFIENIRTELRENKQYTHLRIKGEPGIGKTRGILEATKSEDLAPSIIYCNADEFQASNLLYELIKPDNTYYAILVLDDCDEDKRYYIWDKLKSKSNRIKLVTITNENVKGSPEVGDFEVPLLEIEQISSIIQHYGVPKRTADLWAKECEGFARVAHEIGKNLSNYPDDNPNKSPNMDKFWDRFISGLDDPKSHKVEQRKTALQHLSLFRKFGSPLSKLGVPVISEESTAVLNFIREKTGIDEATFKRIVAILKERKILQGEHTLYITPKLFHIKLWSDYWEIYGEISDIEKFTNNLPANLAKWFQEMFVYAKSSPAATKIVEKLLGPEGIYRDISFLNTSTGADFFLTLSKASPKPALQSLKRLIFESSKEELLGFNQGRRQVVWALERMAEWKDLFQDSARILLRLGEAENESYSNNASGIFVELFSNAFGEVAPSEAGPEDKIPILREAFNSPSKEQRSLALKGCNKALEIESFSRSHGSFDEPFQPSPNRWTPKTYNEWFEAYRGIWNLILAVIDNLPENEKKQAAKILLNNSFGVGKVPALAEMAINTVRDLLDKNYIEKNDVLVSLIEFLWRDNERKKQNMEVMAPEVKQKWEDFNKELAPKDYSSLLERYIALDINVEKYNEETGFATDLTKPIIVDLARQALNNPESLETEYDWLITERAKRGYDFGYLLGLEDKNLSFFNKLIQVYSNNNEKENLNLGLLGGYFRALRERDENVWEEILDALTKNVHLNRFIPALSQAAGLTERGAIRIADLFKQNVITYEELNRFQFGLQILNVSEKTLRKWITFLLSQKDAYAINIALNFLYQYYIHKNTSKNENLKLPADLVLKTLIHKTLFEESQSQRFDRMGTYYWKLVAGKYISLHPNKSLNLARLLIKNFGKDSCLNRGLEEAPKSILNAVAKKYPIELWRIASTYINYPMDKRTMRIKFWLDDATLHFGSNINEEHLSVPLEELWKWIDDNIEERAWFAAWFVPPIIAKSDFESPVAREILIRYGERKDVRNNLFAKFGTTGIIMGPMSNYYKNRLQQFISIRENEDNPIVSKWIDEYIEGLKIEVENSLIIEEREG